MYRLLVLTWLWCAALWSATPACSQDQAPVRQPLVLQAVLDNQSINPSIARFVERAVRQAERDRAACLILMLDTPGGLLDSTRAIVKTTLASDVPVVVYVAPAGGRAASAGVFITLAAHVAAMAPGTHIGAAHPVQIGFLPGSTPADKEKGEDREGRASNPFEEKALNDTVAWARTLAELRGRNADWAAQAVEESISAPASEAVRQQAVDFLADDLQDLLAKLDGRAVSLARGTVRLETAGAVVRTVEMWWGEQLLATIANPNVALLLLIFGFYGVLFELYTPGWGVPGTLGVICLLLGLFALSVLPINYAGLALVAVALALFAAEVFVASYGALTIGGVICLLLGGLILVDSPTGFQRVSLGLLLPVAAGTAALTIFLVGSVVRAHRRPLQTGEQALARWPAVAAEDFVPNGQADAGVVRTRGELWKAASAVPIGAGQHLEIRGRQGLILSVRPSSPQPSPSARQTTCTRPASYRRQPCGA